MAKVSILIINWNTKELLKRALVSVRETVNDINWEGIVVDNGSIDGSTELIEAEFKDFKLVKNYKNLGFAKAVNLGIQKAKGDFILLLNSDAALQPNTLKQLLSVIENDSKIGVVGAELVYADQTPQNSVDHIPNLATEVLNKSVLKWLFPKWYPGKRSGFTEPTVVPSLIGAGMLLRKKTLDEVGLFDERYFFFLEETDWCYQINKKGWKCVYVPGVKILHLQGRSAKKYPNRSKVEFYRSRYYFFKKNYGFGTCLILTIGLIIKILIGWLTCAIASLFTLFLNKNTRKRFVRYNILLFWHILGCPKKMGLTAI